MGRWRDTHNSSTYELKVERESFKKRTAANGERPDEKS